LYYLFNKSYSALLVLAVRDDGHQVRDAVVHAVAELRERLHEVGVREQEAGERRLGAVVHDADVGGDVVAEQVLHAARRGADDVGLLAGGKESVVADGLGGHGGVGRGDAELGAEHAVGAGVARAHEHPEALAREAVEDDAGLAALEQHRVARERDAAAREREVAADAARGGQQRARARDGVDVVEVAHAEPEALGHARGEAVVVAQRGLAQPVDLGNVFQSIETSHMCTEMKLVIRNEKS
jgi:hypothetical protein